MAFEKVARLEDIPVGEARAAQVNGEPIAVVRLSDDVVKAVHNICSHEYFELAPDGWIEDNTIECPKHGSVFDLDSGEPDSLPAVTPIPVYACKIENGEVYVDAAESLNGAEPPRFL